MAEEQKNQPTPIDPANPPEPIQEMQDKTIREVRDVPVETIPDAKLPPEAQAVKAAESPDARDTRRAGEDKLNKPIEAIEDALNAADKQDQAIAAQHLIPADLLSATTTIRGYTFPLPLYAFIYVVLAAITLLEIIISSFPHSILTTIPLIICSFAKAVLVILFYMHLREDSRLFVFVLLLPVFIALVASIFLLTVPISGYK